jgi:hypothetical protein
MASLVAGCWAPARDIETPEKEEPRLANISPATCTVTEWRSDVYRKE